MDKKEVAQKIEEIRKEKGLTQEELADQAKINLRTIQRIEKAESEPRGKTLQLISEALEINKEELTLTEKFGTTQTVVTKIINGLFLLGLNLILMMVTGYLTLDSGANLNSKTGAYLLSVFLPYFIVTLTSQMNGIQRMLKFGSGYLFYFFFVLIKLGFIVGFVTSLFPCLLLSLSVLYFGNTLMRIKFDKV